jgi:hypothetical protein
MDFLINLFWGGLNGLVSYLSAHVITCLVPALFIAGAIAAFVSQAAVLKYFGPQARKLTSYSVASVSGAVLAVCSCTVLPLFAVYINGEPVWVPRLPSCSPVRPSTYWRSFTRPDFLDMISDWPGRSAQLYSRS